jgi:uncharacterized protein
MPIAAPSAPVAPGLESHCPDRKPVFRKCPRCGSYNVRRSSIRVADPSTRPILRSPYRCRDCDERFWVTSRGAYYLAATIGVVVAAVVAGLIATGDWHFGGSEPEAAIPFNPQLESTLKLAESGDRAAERQIAQMHALGDGVPRSEKEAAAWMERAAGHGDTEAQYEFGMALRDGRGVVQDDKRAFEWLQQAADAGHARAQFELGRMYFNGTGIPTDKVKAYTWLNLAAAGGAIGAASLRDSVRGQLTPDDIVKAQAEARQLSEVLSSKAAKAP